MSRPASRFARRLLAPLAGLALAAAALGACAAPAPGAAASVGGKVIGQDAVATVVSEFNPIYYAVAEQLGATDEQLQSALLTPTDAVTWLVISSVVADVASEAGVAISAEQASERLDSFVDLYSMPADTTFSQPTVTYYQTQANMAALLGSSDPDAALAEVNTRAADLDVTLSPRFGTWGGGDAVVLNSSGNPVLGPVVGATSLPWIAVPAADAA